MDKGQSKFRLSRSIKKQAVGGIQSDMETLPAEMLLRIAEFLPMESVLNFRLVCSWIYHAVDTAWCIARCPNVVYNNLRGEIDHDNFVALHNYLPTNWMVEHPPKAHMFEHIHPIEIQVTFQDEVLANFNFLCDKYCLGKSLFCYPDGQLRHFYMAWSLPLTRLLVERFGVTDDELRSGLNACTKMGEWHIYWFLIGKQ